MTERQGRQALVLLYAVLWTALAVFPVDRADWALENALVLLFVVVLHASGRWLTLSWPSLLGVFAFLSLHAIGAHYTYSLVPYDRWAEAATGRTVSTWLGLDRNHFDRMVHFAYGLLLSGAIREILPAAAIERRWWRQGLPVSVVLALSAAYEVVEWAAASLFGGDLGIAYVGAQGDVWDAQKDMALALAGALLAAAAESGLRALAAHGPGR